MKPGSADVRTSVNNIYKVPGQGRHSRSRSPRHTDGNLFWPSMSSDGKVIVYEEQLRHLEAGCRHRQGLRDQARHRERRKRERSRHRDGQQRSRFVRHLAVRPAGGDLGARPDSDDRDRTRRHHARRARRDGVAQPVPELVGRRQIHRLRLGPFGPRRDLAVAIRTDATPKKITDLDNEKGTLVWTPDSKALLYTAADKKLYSYSVADGKTAVVISSDVARIGSVSVSPDSKWVAFSKQDRTLRSHVYIAPIARRRGAARLRRQPAVFREQRGVDCRRPVSGLHVDRGFSNGIASQGGINTTMALWALSLRDQDRDPMNRDIDNEAQGLAAEAAARQNAARGGAGAPPPDVRIDWSGLSAARAAADRARHRDRRASRPRPRAIRWR